jgi:anti-anti-sigma regulatory factor
MEQQTEIGLETIGDVTLFDIKGDVTALSEPFGIALLIQILAETKRSNQQTGIAGLSDHFKKIFGMVGITKFAKIYNTLDDALKAMSGPS